MTTSWQDVEWESIRQRLESCPILLSKAMICSPLKIRIEMRPRIFCLRLVFESDEMLAEFDKLILDYYADDFSRFADWQLMKLNF